MNEKEVKFCPVKEMIKYATGDCAASIMLNSMFAFAMLYYTDALGLKHSLAGIAMGSAIFWDAITDPIMGHITDNTRSKFGRRHPYMLIGGLLMVTVFYFLWVVPDFVKADTRYLFWYMVVMNLLLRTTFTVFMIPYMALGFEMCTDYAGRTKLQGTRTVMNMIANICGPALAWTIFFQNKDNVRATSIESNFVHMGSAFMIAGLFFIVFVCFSTYKYARDSRDIKLTGNSVKGFAVDMKEIISDKYPRWVFIYMFLVVLGISLLSTLQMYLYEHFMKFGGTEKSIAHGGTMVGMGLGGFFASIFAKKIEKKGAIFAGVVFSVSCNFILAVLFLPGILKPGQCIELFGAQFPIAFVIFVIFHGAYWFGNGVMLPVAMSMMADVSEINELKTGINKDGAYSAVFSFAQKTGVSAGILTSGYLLSLIGFIAGKGQLQSDQVIWRLCALTLLAGPAISMTALVLINKYPVNRLLIEKLRKEFHNQKFEPEYEKSLEA